MSQAPPEGNQPEGTDNGGINPAWQPLLEQLPAELHTIVTPHLKQWDASHSQAIEAERQKYSGFDAYKDLVDNKVDPQYLQGALHLAQQFKDNPDAVIEQAVKAYNLEHWQKSQAPNEPEFDAEEWGGLDISKHPVVQQLAQQVQSLTQGFQTQQQEDEEAAAIAQYEQDLAAAHKGPNGEDVDFDDLFVTALVQQGVELPDAVNKYQELFKAAVAKVTPPNAQQTQQQTQQTPPVVMGNSGTVGSGQPNQAVKPSDMSDGQVEDLVVNFLKQAEQQNQ